MKFENVEEERIAYLEGWCIRGDRVRTRYDENGAAFFLNESQIIQMLGERGRESSLHQRMYLDYPWNAYDDWECRARGYWMSDKRGLTPPEKQEEVLRAAEQGDLHSMKILRYLAIWRLTQG